MTDAWMPGAHRLPAAADGGCLKGGAPRAAWLVLHADPRTMSARAAAEHLVELGRPCHLVWNPLSGEVVQLLPVVRAGRALGWPDGPRWGPGSAGVGRGPGPGPGQPGWGSGSGWTEAPPRAPGSGAEGQEWAGNSDWMQPGEWAQNHEWAQEADGPEDEDWTGSIGWTHGADWSPGTGWTHGPGRRQMAEAGRRPPGEPTAPAARDGLAGVNNEGRVCAQIGVIGHGWTPFTQGPVLGAREIVGWLDSWHVARGWPAGRPAAFPDSTRPGQHRRRHWARGGHFGASQVPGCSGAGPGDIDTERLTGVVTGQRGSSAPRAPGPSARISAMTWQPRLTPARSAAP